MPDCEVATKLDGGLVVDRERKVSLATARVGRQGEEQLGRLTGYGVPDQVGQVEGPRASGQADYLVVPVAHSGQVVDLENDVIEKCHVRSPFPPWPSRAEEVPRSARPSLLLKAWGWLALLPGLMIPKRISASYSGS